MSIDLCKWLFETAKAQARFYAESMEQFPSVEQQQAHWQAKDDQEAEELRLQRERNYGKD